MASHFSRNASTCTQNVDYFIRSFSFSDEKIGRKGGREEKRQRERKEKKKIKERPGDAVFHTEEC